MDQVAMPSPVPHEPTRRVRWITRERAEKLFAELPAHQQAMMQFALETGLRRSNVTE